jgi:hypothetical protein
MDKEHRYRRIFVLPAENLPKNLSTKSQRFITSGYLGNSENHLLDVYHLRTFQKKYYSVKDSGDGLGVLVQGVNREISSEEHEDLWLNIGRPVSKIQFRLVIEKLPVFVNIFTEHLGGYFQIEVRFDSLEEATNFLPPSWFGKEVTDNRRHSGYMLSIHGIPRE